MFQNKGIFTGFSIKNLKYDFPASIAVFLVAVPLCLGVAVASDVPLLSGLISAIIGGILVGFLSPSPLAVSGPAAGLTVIILQSVHTLGSFNALLLAVFLSGLIQIFFGLIRAGGIADYLPSSVIGGMLTSIGLILISKEIFIMFGFFEGQAFRFGSMLIGSISLISLIVWEKYFYSRIKILPGALVAVFLGIFINFLFHYLNPSLILNSKELVNLPLNKNVTDMISTPDWSGLFHLETYKVGLTIALIASVESLLSLEAIEKLDPLKRRVSANKELIAQGTGNALAGLIGGIPITSVIVRGTVNISAGAVSKFSTILHGILLLFSLLVFSQVLNYIPMATLAAILVYTGFKLASPRILIQNFKKGKQKFIPFIITVTFVLIFDLLIGVIAGLITCTLYTLKKYHDKKVFTIYDNGIEKVIQLDKNITFFHKKQIIDTLKNLPESINVCIDGSKCEYIHYDVIESIYEFQFNAIAKKIQFRITGLKGPEFIDSFTH